MSSLQSTELFQQQAYINGQWLAAQGFVAQTYL